MTPANALEELFAEIEQHAVMRAHASLLLRAKGEYQAMLVQKQIDRQNYKDAINRNGMLQNRVGLLRGVLQACLPFVQALQKLTGGQQEALTYETGLAVLNFTSEDGEVILKVDVGGLKADEGGKT